jgi:5-methylcytosine-specific restriction endonuclease McrA
MLDSLRAMSPRDIAAYKVSLNSDPCAYCNERGALLDHITPKALGGGDGWHNRIAACARCNGSKGARSLLAFLGCRVHRHRWEAADRDRTAWNAVGA